LASGLFRSWGRLPGFGDRARECDGWWFGDEEEVSNDRGAGASRVRDAGAVGAEASSSLLGRIH
jgi:hypothetical protein